MDVLANETEDDRILTSLAMALANNPRATLQTLAKAVGIGKTTLYRFCKTREQLIERLTRHSAHAIDDSIRMADLDKGPPLEALRRLINCHMAHWEQMAFLVYFWRDSEATWNAESECEAALDAFFLRGQQQGVFRIDIPAAALTEIWGSIWVGLADAARRGRVARSGLEVLAESAFLNGVRAK